MDQRRKVGGGWTFESCEWPLHWGSCQNNFRGQVTTFCRDGLSWTERVGLVLVARKQCKKIPLKMWFFWTYWNKTKILPLKPNLSFIYLFWSKILLLSITASKIHIYRVSKYRLPFLYHLLLNDVIEYFWKLNLVLILTHETIIWNHLEVK